MEPEYSMIEVLVGAIASGKSSYSSFRARKGAVIVNDDAIVNAVHGGVYDLYSTNLKPLYKSVENLIIHQAVALGKDVVIDRGNNNKRASRRRFVAIADSLDVMVSAIVFPFEGYCAHAKRRYDSDSRGLSFEHWKKVAERHEKEFEMPTASEGFESVYLLTPDALKARYL